MRYLRVITILFTTSLFCLVACQKWKDPEPKTDPRLSNYYCNDPEAVNYNWGFPGTPNDSVCYYPADKYKGIYFFKDSVYLSNNAFTYAPNYQDSFIYVYALSKTKIGVIGLCSGGDTIKFTVDRALRATVDSATGFKLGQPFCDVIDTVTGGISPDLTDSTNKRFIVNLTVASDTGINFHKGFAIKQ